jgi:probable rRNA maturation factor
VTSSPLRQVHLSIAKPFRGKLSEDWLHQVAQQALDSALQPEEPGQIDLMVTDDPTLRKLNKDYRGLDEVTDVLAFSYSHSGRWEGEQAASEAVEDTDPISFVLPPDEPQPLGEVIISYPQAQRQAIERDHPLQQELTLLTIHGILHLVGYDHMEPADATRMQAVEQAALTNLGNGGQQL